MTLDELIERLEELRDNLGTGDGNVKIAIQPSYPIACVIDRVVTDQAVQEGRKPDPFDVDADDESIDIWIATDQCSERPYAPENVWEA